MDGSVLMQIRSMLLQRRQKIGSDLIRERDVELSQGNEHQAEMIDIAQSLEQLDRSSSLHQQERRELAAIDRALGKMLVGKYGICEECEEPIPDKRLMVVPQARFCARCQEFEERQNQRGRGNASPMAR